MESLTLAATGVQCVTLALIVWIFAIHPDTERTRGKQLTHLRVARYLLVAAAILDMASKLTGRYQPFAEAGLYIAFVHHLLAVRRAPL